MTEIKSRVDQGHPETPTGMRQVAGGERWQVLDDEVNGLAIVNIENGQGKRLEIDTIKVPRPETKLGWKIIEYIADACKGRRGLVPFVLEHRSTMKLADYLWSRSRSLKSLKDYSCHVRGFCNSPFIGRTPDELVDSCFEGEGVVDRKQTHRLSELLDKFTGELDADGWTQGSLCAVQAMIKSFFRANGIELEPQRRYSMRVTYRDRAPKPEEVQRLIEVASLRGKAMIAMLATGGFRIGTLLRLKYRHVKEDLEAGRTPIHIHIEVEITKGKYADYDTFINDEAAHYLKLYLEERRRGTEKIPPEIITDESYLFVVPHVDPVTRTLKTKPLGESTAHSMMRKTFTKAGLNTKVGKMYQVRTHSYRKHFKTQGTTLGMPGEYCDYFMGHKLDTYLDVANQDKDLLRDKYAQANLRIQPQPQAVSINDLLERLLKAKGVDVTRRLLEEGIGPGMDVITEEEKTQIYAREVWQLMRSELDRERLESLSDTPDEHLKTLVR